MSNYFRLTKILLINGLKSSMNKKIGKKKSIGKGILYAVAALGLLPLFVMFFTMSNILYDILAGVGQQGLVLVFGFWATSMVIFFFGFFYVINVFYFSNDIENLLPLPLRPSEILGAKFTVALIYEYITELFFLLPILISFGYKQGFSLPFAIYAVLIFLTLPIIPLIYASIVNMVIMRFTNIGKNKDLLKTAGGILAVFLGIGINIIIQRTIGRNIDPEKIQEMFMAGNNSLMSISNSIFPSNKYAALSIANSLTIDGLINFAFYMAFTAVFIVMFVMLGELLYFKGVLGVSEVSSKRKKLTTRDFDKTIVESPIIKSYAFKELKLLVRTPIFFTNCIMMNFIWPVFFIIPFLAGKEDINMLSSLFSGIRNTEFGGIVIAAAFGLSIFISTSNLIAPTSISREGQNIYFSKYIPVSYKDQIWGKLLSSLIVGISGTAGMFVIVAVFIGIPVHILIMCILVSVLAVLFTSLVGILIDIKSPKLDWDNEQKAVKQNMNGVVSMLLCFIIGAISVVPLIILRLNPFMTFIAIMCVYGLVNLLLYNILMKFGIKAFNEIEA
ncbi:MAG: putative ABC transporter permease subunit [Bacillota bacterium]